MNQRGFSLVEILVALLLLGSSLLAVVPLFATASRSMSSSAQISTISAVVSQRMELLLGIPFENLTAGGSLGGNSAGFFDSSDPDVLVRWRITDDATPATIKTLEVWGRAIRVPVGVAKELTITGRVAQ